MNPIIKGYLSNFISDFSISDTASESAVFEHFVNYLIISKANVDAIEKDYSSIVEMSVDKGSQYGIDGVAILANGSLIKSKSEVDGLARFANIDVQIYFTQIKTSEKFDIGCFNNFLDAIDGFLDWQEEIASEELKAAHDMFDYLLEKCSRALSASSPKVIAIYAYGGDAAIENDLTASVIARKKTNYIKKFSYIPDVEIKIVAASDLIKMYRDVENTFEVEIDFRDKTELTEIKDVNNAFIGLLPFEEFLKLIEDEDKNIRSNIFFENVRDFQGFGNAVNREILETIKSKELQELFPLLNNGVTIVASTFKPIRQSKYIMRSYQIVNGCQTSHVIYSQKDELSKCKNSISIPVKIVNTTDREIIGKIVKATNRQTPVPDEAFLALTDFHKNLQEYFFQYPKDARLSSQLLYERRSREYSLLGEGFKKNQIVTLHKLIGTYCSMVLLKPHLIYNNNPNEIYRTQADLFFQQDHRFEPYFAAAYFFYKLECGISSGWFGEGVREMRHYYSAAANIILNQKTRSPLPNSKEIICWSKAIIEVAESREKLQSIVAQAKEIIDGCILAERNHGSRFVSIRVIRQSSFSNLLFEKLREKYIR